MIRHLSLFIVCFLLGALVTLALRTARHDPHAQVGIAPQSIAPTSVPVAVNTVCAICGMAVDPEIPTALYQGKAIGFGCKACPPKFAAQPQRYGPAALANQVVE
jgi:hypothetical protein